MIDLMKRTFLATMASVMALSAAHGASGGREVLPDTVAPTHYAIAIVPDEQALTFTGTVDAPEAGVDQRIRRSVAGGVAGLSSNLQRIADIQAYAEKNIPEDARDPIKGSIASIKARHRVVTEVLPELNRWIAAALTTRRVEEVDWSLCQPGQVPLDLRATSTGVWGSVISSFPHQINVEPALQS